MKILRALRDGAIKVLRTVGEWIAFAAIMAVMAVITGIGFLFFKPQITIPLIAAFALVAWIFGMKVMFAVLGVLIVIYFILCIIGIILVARMCEAIDMAHDY